VSRDSPSESTAGSAPRREPHQQRNRSVSDVLSDDRTKGYLTYTTSIFAIVGAGFGLTGALGTRLLFDGSDESGFVAAFFMIVLFGVMVFTGPILGAISGLQLDRQMADTREAMITAFASGTLGYVVMTIVGVLVTVVFSPSTDSADTGGTGGSGGTDLFDLGDVLVPLIAMAIPVGLVAAGVIYVGDRFLE
jgi:hypothetical protein